MLEKKTRLLTWALFLLPLLAAACRAPAGTGRERSFRRGLWVTRWDFRHAADVERIVADAAGMGFDHILFQVRGNGDALYRSAIEPWSELLGGEDPGFDPLATAVAAGRRRGLAVHAWVNVVAGWRGLEPPRSREHLYHTHPEWFLTGRGGRRQPLKKDYYVALNPCLPEVRTYLARLCADIVGRYGVAGLHLDYIRFLETGAGEDYPRDARTLALFSRETGAAGPDEDPARWDRWRKECIDRLVREIAAAARRARPGVALSAAVARSAARRRRVFQDPGHWAARGWVGALYPMLYERNRTGRFMSYAAEMLTLQKYGVKVVTGIGSWLHAADPGKSVEFIRVAREMGADGVAIFAYSALFPSPARAESPPAPAARRRLRRALEPLISGRRL